MAARRIVRKTLLHLRKVHLTKALAAWCKSAADQRRQDALMHRVARRMLRRRLGAAFDAWYAASAAAQQNQDTTRLLPLLPSCTKACVLVSCSAG